MQKKMIKSLLSLLLIVFVCSITGAATLKWKALPFGNPGSKRVLKTEQGSYFYYRSLPEKNMLLSTKDIATVEIRSFSKVKADKAEFILHMSGKKIAYSPKFNEIRTMGDNKYYTFEPVRIVLPPKTDKLELTCYDRNVYFRAFQVITITPKPKVPALKILSQPKVYTLASDKTSKPYYAFRDKDYLRFQINKGKTMSLYLRAELINKEIPVFALYKDGQYIQQIQLPVKRTKTYKVEGILNLTIGKRVDFPAISKIAVYELRPVTDHLFLARPIILKAGR